MAKALQHSQTALIARLSTTGTTDDEPVPDTARSGRANAIISPSRWYKKSVRSKTLGGKVSPIQTQWLKPGDVTIPRKLAKPRFTTKYYEQFLG